MQLLYSPTSPFVRKVLVVAIEKGIGDRIERRPTNILEPHADLLARNPLGKIPVLITDDGDALYDSPVIVEYLDAGFPGPRLIPAAGPARFQALRQQALADGLLDAGVARIVEGRRPEAERSQAWTAKQTAVVARALDALEAEAGDLHDAVTIGPVTIGPVAIGCALGWLDFRFPHEPWQNARPALADWFARFSQRPSMQATIPRDPPTPWAHQPAGST